MTVHCLTAEIAQGTVRVRQEVRAWPQATFVLVKYKQASPGKALKDCGRLCCPLCQRGENKVSAVPAAPHICFQPLSPRLAYRGFREQCSQ